MRCGVRDGGMDVRVAVEPELRARVRVRCAELGITLGAAVRQALEMWVERRASVTAPLHEGTKPHGGIETKGTRR